MHNFFFFVCVWNLLSGKDFNKICVKTQQDMSFHFCSAMQRSCVFCTCITYAVCEILISVMDASCFGRSVIIFVNLLSILLNKHFTQKCWCVMIANHFQKCLLMSLWESRRGLGDRFAVTHDMMMYFVPFTVLLTFTNRSRLCHIHTE